MTHISFHAAKTPDHIAYIMAGSGAGITYGALEQRSNQGAHLLRSLGIGQQDHIALIAENSLAFMEIAWACQRSGIYYTCISTHLTPAEIAYIVGDCGAKVFIASDTLAAAAQEVARQIDPGIIRFMIGDVAPGFADWTAAVDAQPPTPIADEIVGYDMLYSSGTTGRPKGVKPVFKGDKLGTVSPLLGLLAFQTYKFGADTIYLSPAPLYHAAPLRYNMMVGIAGGTSVIMERFDAEEFLRLVALHKATHTQLVPTMFVRMLKLPEAARSCHDMGSLRVAIHAAAPCPVPVKEAMIAWWGPILFEYYGGTEGNGITTIDSPQWLAHKGSVGRALIGELKICGEDGSEVALGAVGTIYFAGGPPFAYHNDPEKTRGAHHAKGWSTLGDVGYLDAEGYLYLTDRKAYMIISGGVNVYPQETEDVLVGHPEVADAAVFGVPNEELGEEVKAVVQLLDSRRAGPAMAAELMAHCRRHLSAIKSPKSIDFELALPRTPTGKLMKRLLRDKYWAHVKKS